jgi:ABC-2 type transport system permease protein
MLRFYLEAARAAFRRQVIYRWANLAGLAANTFFGIILSYVYLALYQSRASAGGFTAVDTLRYLWLMQAITMVVLTFGWYDLLLTIRSGDVVADLNKPCDFFWYWFSREAGRSAYYLIFRGLPTYAIGALLFGLGLPGGPARWLAFALALLGGTALGITFRFLTNITAFWLVEGRAAAQMLQIVALFCAGTYVPLAFFPTWLRVAAEWLPFGGMQNVAGEVFTGRLAGSTLLPALAWQAVWIVALIVLARVLTAAAMRRVVVQGG